MSSFLDEPKQQPQTQHIIGDERSRVWLETKETDATPNYPALISSSVSWVAFSALVFKLVRVIASFVSLPVLAVVIGFLLVPLAFVAYRTAKDDDGKFRVLFNFTLVVAGIVVGGF